MDIDMESVLIHGLKPPRDMFFSNNRVTIGTGNRIMTEYKPGESINEFVVKQVLGGGASSKVYLCEDTSNGDICAVKTVMPSRSDTHNLYAFYQELSRMIVIPRCANVLNINSVFIYNDIPHISMPYIFGVTENGQHYGCTLANLIDNQWSFSFLDILWIAIQVCRGMAHCQNSINEFVHGDIKPSNILFEPLEQDVLQIPGLVRYRVILSDFGVGAKTSGYYVSDDKETATAEDDIFAFMTVAERLCNLSARNGATMYHAMFKNGIDEALYREYSHEIRCNLTFSSLFNGYAEALESFLGLNNQGLCAEDVLPKTNESLRMKCVDTLNLYFYYTSILNDYETAIEKTLELYGNPETENMLFDSLPVRALFLTRLIDAYLKTKQWDLFDDTLVKLQAVTEHIERPIQYRGIYFYSNDLDSDIFVIKTLSCLLKGDSTAAEQLIQFLNERNCAEEWVALLPRHIEPDDKLCELFEMKMIAFSEAILEDNRAFIKFSRTMGEYYSLRQNFQKALYAKGTWNVTKIKRITF